MITRRIVLAGAASLAFTASASAEDWKAKYPEITFAVIPAENGSGVLERYTPFVNYLSKELGIKVNLRVANDYAAVIEGQRASTLSGGQQQRAAIARALVQRARIILADEPIASLDPESSRRVMEILARINREDGTTIVVSLHQVDYALGYCQRVVALRDGKIVFDGPSATVTKELLREFYGSELDQLGSSATEPQRVDPRRQAGRARLPLAAAVEATL